MAASTSAPPESEVSYEDLADLELEFETVDSTILRQQNLLQAPLYARRKEMVAKVPLFWPLVLEQAPPEVDQFIQPTDSTILAAHLVEIDVVRFEVPPHATDQDGEPRSFSVKFVFSPNDYFEDEVLEKKFWFRRGPHGWTGLVSEPVKIRWKDGKDVTEGLVDAAYDAWEAEKKQAKLSKDELLPEHKIINEKMASITDASLSFFTWFGFRGPHVSAEESVAAHEAEAKRRRERKAGGGDDPTEEEPIEPVESPLDDVEVFPGGEELAVAISDDLFPGAVKYFTQSQEEEGISDADFEEAEDDDDDDAEPPTLLDLIGGDEGSSEAGEDRPKKKVKT